MICMYSIVFQVLLLLILILLFNSIGAAGVSTRALGFVDFESTPLVLSRDRPLLPFIESNKESQGLTVLWKRTNKTLLGLTTELIGAGKIDKM